jgi:hypothetical protein
MKEIRNQEKRIEIKNENKSIVKFGFGLTAFFSFFSVFMFALLGFLYFKKEPFSSLLYFGLAVFFFVVARNYIANTFFKEYVVLDNKKIKIVYKSWGKFKESEFEFKKVEYIKFVDKENFTNHPLDSETIDYTGFGVAEKELQKIISDGTIEIKTDEKKFRFGKEIPSWEAERIIDEINNYRNKNSR